MKAISESEFKRVFKYLHEHLLTRGFNPEYMKLYNEASTAFQRELKVKNIEFQLAPPVIYFCNAAECAISTFKDHFMVGLCSTDLDLPIQNWDILLEQAEITLKLFHLSRLNLIILAYAQLNIPFNCNRTPMIPPKAPELYCTTNRTTGSPG